MVRSFRMTIAAMFASLVLSALSVTAPAHASPEAFVTSLSAQVLAAAKTNNTAQFRQLLRAHADVRGIADFALGRFKNKLPNNQRARYYQLAENDIVRFFGDYSGSLQGSGVDVKRVVNSGSFIRVDTTITGSNSSVIWKLVQHGGYKVRDVQVAGIWLANLMRSNYSSILRRSGYKALFAHMQR